MNIIWKLDLKRCIWCIQTSESTYIKNKQTNKSKLFFLSLVKLPGQSPRLHFEDSTLGPRFSSAHVSPPYSGSGFVHVRVLFLIPGPQEVEHAPQLDHEE